MSGRLTEVAQKVGVSEATVSRVLNGKPGVSAATREQVLTALDVLGYERPTKLRGERARLVGLVLPELQNPIFPAFAAALGGGLVERGFTPLLYTETTGGLSESEQVTQMLAQQVAGVIFVGGAYALRGADHDHYRHLESRALPVVLMNASIDEMPFPRVTCDDAVAMEEAFRLLLSLGHTEIGLVMGPPDHVPSERKITTARALAAQHGIVLGDDRIRHGGYSLENGQASASALLAEGVTGIICANDPLALGALRAVRRAGLRVPQDVSVIGYDDSPLMTCVDPPLTTVRQPTDAMSREAIEILIAQIEGRFYAESELLFEPELVVRSSTGPAPVAG
mgnify:CR=1 FL=1